MMQPNEFLSRVVASVDDIALALSHSPYDLQKKTIKGFADRLRPEWREAFAPALTADDVDGMVDDVVTRVWTRLGYLETLEGGRA